MILLFWLSLALADPVSAPDSMQAPASGQVNVDQYFNLGLEMEAQEQRGQAALAYRRGLLLAPHDAQVQERLALLRALPDQGPLLGPNFSGWLGILSIGAAFLLLAAWRMQGRWMWVYIALPLVLLGAGLMVLTERSLSAWGSQGLVLESAVVTSQAGDGGQLLFELEAFQTVEILAHGEGAIQIRTQDARVGWMSAQQVGILDPRAGARSLR